MITPHALLFYASAHAVRERLLKAGPEVTLDLEHNYDLDVETLDMFADVSKEVDLRFVNVHPEAAKRLQRAGLQPASE